jgi:hypothetical protein
MNLFVSACLWSTGCLCGAIIYPTIKNYLVPFRTTHAVRVSNNVYEVAYYIRDVRYKFMVHVRRGPNPVIQVYDGESRDVTDSILPYLGPNHDFHVDIVQPDLSGYTFILDTGDELEFSHLKKHLANKYKQA